MPETANAWHRIFKRTKSNSSNSLRSKWGFCDRSHRALTLLIVYACSSKFGFICKPVANYLIVSTSEMSNHKANHFSLNVDRKRVPLLSLLNKGCVTAKCYTENTVSPLRCVEAGHSSISVIRIYIFVHSPLTTGHIFLAAEAG